MQLFAAIDFETATSERTSACAIGYVIFNKTKIIKKVSHLIRPPKPEVSFYRYSWFNMGYVKES